MYNRMQLRHILGALGLSLLLLCSCGKGDGQGAKLAPVRGRVTFKNEAVTAADIYFIPDASKGNHGTMGSSMLQEDGSFTIETYGKGAGVVPGAYKVKLNLGRRNDKELAKYARVETSQLAFDVGPEGLDNLHIELMKP